MKIDYGSSLNAKIEELERRIEDMRYQRRHKWLAAFEHGATYSEIGKANDVDEVSVYRHLAKARQECERFIFPECKAGDHAGCPRYRPPKVVGGLIESVPELCTDRCHRRKGPNR